MITKSILIVGAGRSSTSLIQYLLRQAIINSWQVIVGDFNEAAARDQVGATVSGRAIRFDITDEGASRVAIRTVDLVISLIPAHLHMLVAKICLEEKKHLLTASYVSDEMKSFHEEALLKGLLFLNECGLDPGIDHMSAMQLIEKIKDGGGKLTSFESFTGGLIAPETDLENPWRYKFTWNPRNVVMAGQGTAKFLERGSYKYIPYQQLFKRFVPVVVPDVGEFEGYANRDSLKYLETYGLNDIKTMLRGTLRNKGYCSAWDVLAQLGCCDDTYPLEGVADMSHVSFINSFLEASTTKLVEEKLMHKFNLSTDSSEMKRLQWSGLFSKEKVGIERGTPAQVLEHILNKRWKLQPGDRDMIIMWHRFRYEIGGEPKETQAYLMTIGDDEIHTAMAKTVGLPLAIMAKLLLQGRIKSRGVVIPVVKEIYEPVLAELAELGIKLIEIEVHQ
jgi:saccharopine dehydrogenase (NADP+, L-glutamate forming)